jgi:hypothetical protein
VRGRCDVLRPEVGGTVTFETVMNRLLVITAKDGSSLVLSEPSGDRQQPAAPLFFEHVDRSEPRPVVGHFNPFSVIIDDQRYVVFAGTTPGGASVDAVLIQFPDHSRSYPVNNLPDRPGVWMSFPEPFYDGQAIRIAWLVDNRVYREETSAPLVWQPPETPNPSPRGPGPRPVRKSGDGWSVTQYAYIEDEDEDGTQIS